MQLGVGGCPRLVQGCFVSLTLWTTMFSKTAVEIRLPTVFSFLNVGEDL